MKSTILLLLLLPISVFAKFYSGSINFKDGSSKSGLIEVPDHNDSKIKFKMDENAKVEKFKTEDVKSFEVLNDKNETENYISIKVGNNKILSPKKFNIDKDPKLVQVVKQGKISIYKIHFRGNSASGSNGRMVNNYYEADVYYMQRENDDFAFNIGIHRYDLNFMSGIDLYQVAKINFSEICPSFPEKIKEAKLEATQFSKLVDIYEQNCGK